MAQKSPKGYAKDLVRFGKIRPLKRAHKHVHSGRFSCCLRTFHHESPIIVALGPRFQARLNGFGHYDCPVSVYTHISDQFTGNMRSLYDRRLGHVQLAEADGSG